MTTELNGGPRCPTCGAALDVPPGLVRAWQHCASCRGNHVGPWEQADPATSGKPPYSIAIDQPVDMDDRFVERHSDDSEPGVYGLAPQRDESLDVLESVENLQENASHSVPATKRNPRSGLGKAGDRGRRNDEGSVRSWWRGMAQMVGIEIAAVFVAVLVGWLVPVIGLVLFGVYVLTVFVLVGAAWVLGFQHAMRNNKFAVILFFLPWYFVKYGIRNWPETRQSVTALGLGLGMLCAPMIVALPLGLISSLLEYRASLPIAAPDPVKPSTTPADPNAAPPPGTYVTSTSVQVTADGTMTTTTIRSDGFTTKSVRKSQSKITPSAEDWARRRELGLSLYRAKLGDVIEAELTGTDREIVTGGFRGVYNLGSAPASAAVHAGALKIDETGKVKITIVPNADKYPSLDQNGVLSLAGASGAVYSYTIERATDN